MRRIPLLALAVLAAAFGTAAASPAGDNVVINEVYANSNGYYDGAEFIELYNPTDAPIQLNPPGSEWVLCGTEYDEACGGEDLWAFPPAPPEIWIGPGEYIVVAKDAGDGDDGFEEDFGTLPDFEMVDPSFAYDSQNDFCADMVLLTDDPATNYSDEIQLVGGRGYGVICTAPTSDADVVYLYDGDPSSGPANLVDLVEYVDPEQCSTDPCVYPFTDDNFDDNAFQGIPFLGNTIGRDENGTDTDMSINDWTMQAPTPKAQNVPNTPPWIRRPVYSPIPPNDTDPTSISAVVTDDGTIDSVMVYYRVDGGSWGKVAAATSDSLYTGDIPAQVDGAIVDYFVRAVDNLGARMNYPAEAMSNPYSYSVGYTTIRSIQLVGPGGDPSPLVGQPVNVRGIVTMGTGTMRDDEFYIHEGTGDFKGIKCYFPGTPSVISEGDDVTFCGTVTEYYGETEVYQHFDEAFVIHSPGNPNHGYTHVTTAQITYNDVASEQYEGQLIYVDNATVTFESDYYGIWYCRDESGVDCKVDDEAYYSYDAEVLDEIAELRGIIFYSYSEYKVQPRYDEDIIGPPRVGDVRYTPIPPADDSATTISAVLSDNVGISSATLHWSYAKARPYPNSVPMTESRYEGTWTAPIPMQIEGTRVYYYVECADAAGMDAERPSAGGYSYYTGVATIQSVQEVPPGGDTSPMDTLAVNVEGYVTTEPGVFNDYTFYIQEDVGAWHGIMVYDGSGSLDFERGDYVVCCGEVAEYYGQTQIDLHFSEAAQLATPPARGDEVDPVSIPTGTLQNVVSGEQYESVFVIAEDCTVYDENVAYGEWAISNETPADTCRVGDYAQYDYVPQNGDNVYVRGVVAYSFGNYKIEPRGNEDIAANPVGVSEDYFGGKFGLAQNMPNPFNPKTTIVFALPASADVTLEVYDVAGRRVATLIDTRLEAGPHEIHWDGVTEAGERAASGVYFYKLKADDQETSRKMVLLK